LLRRDVAHDLLICIALLRHLCTSHLGFYCSPIKADLLFVGASSGRSCCLSTGINYIHPMVLSKNEGCTANVCSALRKPSSQLVCFKRRLIINFSLIALIFAIHLYFDAWRLVSPARLAMGRLMSRLLKACSVLAPLAVGIDSRSSAVIDLSSYEWTLSNPGRNISVPGSVPSSVCNVHRTLSRTNRRRCISI
jgi:hypothetical protein